MKVTFDKIDVSITKDDKKHLMSHGILIIISLFISGYLLSDSYGSSALMIVYGELLVIAIIIVSLLDYLNVIKWRKSVVRHSKCVVCGATDKPANDINFNGSHMGGNIVSGTDIMVDKKTDSKTITEHVPIPAKPLVGYLINNKVVCLDCANKIKELSK